MTSASSPLFSPLSFRSLRAKNRVFTSPMCQYSCHGDGLALAWHLVNLGRYAVGGAGVVFTEATAVSPEGRISPSDLGIWSDAHARALAPIAAFVKEQGAIPGIQLAHAGRKASTAEPWNGGHKVEEANGGWTPVAPSAVAFSPTYPDPVALDQAGIDKVTRDFVAAAKRARSAGFEIVELHAAHGYLLHQFLSPLANRRTDAYGGDFVGRTKLLLDVAAAVRREWPAELPLFVRISATDWAEGGWTAPESIRLAALLRERCAIDLVDCSSGGLVPSQKIPVGPGYQVPFARAIRDEAHVATGAVGLITEPAQASEIVASGSADAVLLARAMIHDPNWALHAAQALGADVAWPKQHTRGSGK
jgi:2,4-dienoyl-CoA reductase-like NADH-dependent reductase (Old Yellow Enzyme family)